MSGFSSTRAWHGSASEVTVAVLRELTADAEDTDTVRVEVSAGDRPWEGSTVYLTLVRSGR